MKLIIGSLLVFSLIILFLFALFPADISVTRVNRIHAPKQKVHDEISDLRKWKQWNEFLSPASSTSAGLQPVLTGDSLRLESGTVVVSILKSLPDTISTRWQRGDKFFTGTYALSEVGGQTIVEWTLHFHVKWYPWEKLASMFYDKQLGPVMERSLVKLGEQIMEN